MLSIEPKKTRVVLIGISKFPEDPELDDLPAVVNNVEKLKRLLTSPDLVGLPEGNVIPLVNEYSPSDVATPLAQAAREAQDTLLVYYSGHGLIPPGSKQLYLSTKRSTQPEAEFNALALDTLRSAIYQSNAKKKILILDCCFSGRAIETMGDKGSMLQSSMDIEGTYALASAPANSTALAPEGAKYTVFTGELINVLEQGIENGKPFITLKDIFNQIRASLSQKPGTPLPQQLRVQDADRIAIAHNRRFLQKIEPRDIHVEKPAPGDFAGYSGAVLYSKPHGRIKRNAVHQLLWGDPFRRLGPREGKWIQVRARGATGWIYEDDSQNNRPLEISFVDVGNGDSCLIATPDDKFIIIDAGEGDNMYRFLRWRFGKYRRRFTFESAIISHPDRAHYSGFEPLLTDTQIHIGTIFHNGIVERNEEDPLGPLTRTGSPLYLTDVIANRAALDKIISDPQKIGKKTYPNLLKLAADRGRVNDIRMLCSEDGFLPGYGPDSSLKIRVLGPIAERGPNGENRLRWFGSPEKTKNGHSIVLQLRYGRVTVLFAGELDVPAQKHLLAYYTGRNPDSSTLEEEEILVNLARNTFQSDIVKVCHHSPGDFAGLYLQALNSLATILSTGSSRPGTHPRPDILGALGRHGRGLRPLVFDTKIGRRPAPTPRQVRDSVMETAKALDDAKSEREKKTIRKRLDKQLEILEKTIASYGSINVRTDGYKVVVARALERPISHADKWEIYKLEPDAYGNLSLVD